MVNILQGINLPQVLAQRSTVGASAIPQYQPNTGYIDQALKQAELMSKRAYGDYVEQERNVKQMAIEDSILDDASRLIANSPMEQRPYLYQDMLRQLEQVGGDVSILPPEYNPAIDATFQNRYNTKFVIPERQKAQQKERELLTEYGLKAGLEDRKGKNALSVQELKNKASENVANIGADASRYGSDARLQSAQMGADASLESAKLKASSMPKLPHQVATRIQDTKDKNLLLDNTIQKSVGIFNDINSGKLNLSLISNAYIKKTAGTPLERNEAVALDNLQRLLAEQVSNVLNAAKGTQTEGDAQRASDQIMGNLGSPEIVKRGLQDLIKINKKLINRNNESISELGSYYGYDTGIKESKPSNDFQDIGGGFSIKFKD